LLIVKGETMTTFACFSFHDLLIPLGFALALGAVIAFVAALAGISVAGVFAYRALSKGARRL
jgi:hypothetical protein